MDVTATLDDIYNASVAVGLIGSAVIAIVVSIATYRWVRRTL